MGLAMTDMRLTSSAFEDGNPIPKRHADREGNVSPPLQWNDAPGGTQSFAVFCHDPDAPIVKAPAYGFVHWVLYNVPADSTGLPEGNDGFTLGRNDYGRRSYDGPRPPEDHGPHRYYFWLLALDSRPDFASGFTLWELLGRIEDNVLGMSRLVGIYER